MFVGWENAAASAAAKSLQSCPTLCDPIDGSPPGSPVPGTASQWLWENLSKEAGGEGRLNTSLQQKEQAVWASEICYQVTEFSIVCMWRCKPLGSLNPFFSYTPQLSGTNPVSLLTLLLAFPQLLSNHHAGWQHPWIPVWGALIYIWRPEIFDGCDISYLLICQEVSSFHRKKIELAVKCVSCSVMSDSLRPHGL